ncbi:MAG: SpoIID/LytB domain-containing protein [Lachnospiraceae bacterium]|nr:SpoIID/LytB domain-containing protein [Lachnospiraceae bacterium]
MKSRIRATIILIFIMLGILMVVMLQFGKKDPSFREQGTDVVSIAEAADSVNLLYDVENYVNARSFDGKPEDIVTPEKILKLLNHLQISEEYTKQIKQEAAAGFIGRAEWGEILLLLGQATGLSQVCGKGRISVYDWNREFGELVSDEGKYQYRAAEEALVDKKISFIHRDNIILFVIKTEEEAGFQNVLIKKTEGDMITVQLFGVERCFEVRGLGSSETAVLENVLADITMEQGIVQELRLKREKISAKVLSVSEDTVELEGFGRISVSPAVRVYKTESFVPGNLSDIVVGSSNVSFVVADREISGAIVHGVIQSANIRVLLNSSGYADMFHDIVTITCQSDFNLIFNEAAKEGGAEGLLSGNEVVHSYKAGEVLSINADNDILKYSRIKIVPTDKNARLKVVSLSRNAQNPQYRGSLEISAYEGRLILINEVSVEEYLYSVVPSEMPSSYGVEALKVQAVCARSYAISHMTGSRLAKYGAHVDDSTTYQVYNNTAETENSISAVDATKGMVMNFNGAVVTAYFYATSCGCTTNGTVWSDTDIPYIRAKYLNPSQEMPDLMNNDVFTEFIKQKPENFDMDSVWYRWNVTLSIETISNSVNHLLYSLYCANENQVLTANASGEFESVPVHSVGRVYDISVTKRGAGGIIEEMIITGDKGKVKIIKQGNIRKIFNPYGNDIVRNDGSVIDHFTTLPSAFFAINKGADGNSFEIYGGGYGHGAGMSQTAVKKMIDQGMDYKSILSFFYPGIEVVLSEAYLG